MARSRDPVAHAVRRDAFLDSALRLIQAKGYARMSIQDVLDDLAVSKGAFYHYFGSKAALLEGVVLRMIDETTAALVPVVADPDRSAPEKFEAVFSRLSSFKPERRDLIAGLMEGWALDDNLIIREKFRGGVIARMTPLLATIIDQGVAEGSFAVAYPEGTARVAAGHFMTINEATTDLLLAYSAGTVTFEEVALAFMAFAEAFERILGVRPGTLRSGERERLAMLREWFDLLAPVIPRG